MKVVFYSLILNNHQANVADELWRLTGHSYCFVELANLQAEHRKGDTHDYRDRPYYLRAWQSDADYRKAMELAITAECCVFSGVQALPFQKERMKRGLLSFDMSERWLKQGLKNILSPAISKMFFSYWKEGWKNEPIYKLCCSAFAAEDHIKLGMYKGKSFKWGYFTKVDDFDYRKEKSNDRISIMWCARFIDWKHPELPIYLAEKLKAKGYDFTLNMYGRGEYENEAKRLANQLNVEDVVNFKGIMPNTELMAEMREHDIFLFTSDKKEGWGAVANESKSNGCVLVASGAIGSTPYLIENGIDGFVFLSPSVKSDFENPDLKSLQSLLYHVERLINEPKTLKKMRGISINKMQNIWSPHNAAQNLLKLIDNLKNGMDTPIIEGPCSKA